MFKFLKASPLSSKSLGGIWTMDFPMRPTVIEEALKTFIAFEITI